VDEAPAPVPRRTALLRNGERAPLDASYTPQAVADACVRWLAEHALDVDELRRDRGLTAVEPSVGGGAWVRAVRDRLPAWAIDRVDVDLDAPGLTLDLADREDAVLGDWLEPLPTVGGERGHGLRRHTWSLLVGNRPYADDVVPWVETSRRRARVVALLERSTILGGGKRWSWWQSAAARPAYVVNVGRVRWEGPGARDTGDFVDSYLVVWIAGHNGPTVYDWIDVAPAEAA
jgi:hypothetical protein